MHTPETATLQQLQGALHTLLREFDRICGKLNIPYVLFAGTLLGSVRHQGFIPWDDDLDVMMLREDYERFLREAEKELDGEKFYLQKEFSPHWPMFFSKLRLNGTAYLEKYHPRDNQCHQGVYMDIFPCDDAAKTGLGRKLQFWASKVVIAKSLDQRGYDTDSRKKKLFMGLCRVLPRKPFLWMTRKGSRKSGLVHSFLGGAVHFEKNIYERSALENRTQAPFEEGVYPVPADYDRVLTVLYGDYMQLPTQEQRISKQHAALIDLNRSYEHYENYRDGMDFETHTISIR